VSNGVIDTARENYQTMNRRTSKATIAGLALGIVWVYVVLALVAPGCSFRPCHPVG